MTNSTGKAPEFIPPPAPLWRRLTAILYDSLLLVAVIMAYGYLHLGVKILLLGEAYKKILRENPAGSTADPLMFAGILIVTFLFFHIFWRRNGQTLGMQAWRIQIQREDNKALTATQTLLRLLIAPLSAFCFGIGYLWCLVRPYKTWQDLATKTVVVLLPKNKAN